VLHRSLWRLLAVNQNVPFTILRQVKPLLINVNSIVLGPELWSLLRHCDWVDLLQTKFKASAFVELRQGRFELGGVPHEDLTHHSDWVGIEDLLDG
jgi:hypothetical protein